MSNDKNGKVEIKIAPPNIQTAEFFIRGTAPLVIHKFSQKAIKAIRDKQELGSLANKNKGRAAKDFNDCFNQARHISTEGWDGFPAGAIRAAMIDACKLCGFKNDPCETFDFRSRRRFRQHRGNAIDPHCRTRAAPT